jgi:hypothetical protein
LDRWSVGPKDLALISVRQNGNDDQAFFQVDARLGKRLCFLNDSTCAEVGLNFNLKFTEIII